MSARRERIEALEVEIRTELEKRVKSGAAKHYPITDGAVDPARYLASSPRTLWILKEPWEALEADEQGGDWSVTRTLIPRLISEGRISSSITYRRMAYVTYSVLNGYRTYAEIPFTWQDAAVAESLRTIAYINVSKFPGRSRSVATQIEAAYQQNREILKWQVETFDPQVIIAGNILPLFFRDFALTHEEMQHAKSVDYAHKDGRLYINAYHPSYWRCKEENYVNDITAVIRQHFPIV